MPAMENTAPGSRGAGARSRSRTSRRFAGTASPSMQHLRAEPTGNLGADSRSPFASATPGTGAAFVEGVIPECSLGSLGSGSTLDIGLSDAINYDRSPVSLSAVRAGPDTRSDAGPENGSEGAGPAVEGHEEESPESSGCGGGDGGSGGGTMGESGLEATVRHHGETLVRLERKVDDGLKELRSDFRFLLGGMGALGLLIVAAAVGVVEYSSPSPIDAQRFTGGYTITVQPLP